LQLFKDFGDANSWNFTQTSSRSSESSGGWGLNSMLKNPVGGSDLY
jgi:hypothetical protein